MTSEAKHVFCWVLGFLTTWPYLRLAQAYLRGEDLSEGNGGPWHDSACGPLLCASWVALLLLSLIVGFTATGLRLLERRLKAAPSIVTIALGVLPWLVVAVQFLTLFWLVD